MSKVIQIIRWYGGKARLFRFINALIKMIKHKTYCEPYVGGGTIFFNKKKSPVEVINDINGALATFYRVCGTDLDSLTNKITNTLHDEHTFKQAKKIYKDNLSYTDLEVAWSVWVGATMSFGGNLFSSFQITSNSTDNCNPAVTTYNKKQLFKELNHMRKRLEKVMILNKDAIDVIIKYNQFHTLFYLDPPYWEACQGHYKGFTRRDHILLMIAISPMSKLFGLKPFQAKFILSTYDDEITRWFAKRYGWNQKKITQRKGVGTGTKIEVLTYNFDGDIKITNKSNQLKLL